MYTTFNKIDHLQFSCPLYIFYANQTKPQSRQQGKIDRKAIK